MILLFPQFLLVLVCVFLDIVSGGYISMLSGKSKDRIQNAEN